MCCISSHDYFNIFGKNNKYLRREKKPTSILQIYTYTHESLNLIRPMSDKTTKPSLYT